MKNKNKKQINPFAKFLLTVLWFLIGIIAVIALWCTFSALDKKNPLSMIPTQYSAYVHTDSFYEAANPLLDLHAADIFLSSDEMSDVRGIFMLLRESELRNNRFVKFLLSRKIDAALYSPDGIPGSFVASIELGVFSSVSRLASLIVPNLNLKNVSKIQTGRMNFFTYQTGETVFYFKPVRNLLIVSNDLNYFTQSVQGNNDLSYTPEQIELLNKKTDNPIKLIINAKELALNFLQENETVKSALSLISDRTLSLVSFQITDNEIALQIEIPVNSENENFTGTSLENISNLLSQDSTVPELPTRLSNIIQYYTILNAGTIDELKKAVFPFVPEEKNISGLWQTANSLCKTFFNISFDDIISSWTEKEFAVFGIEDLNEPVFAIKISDEKKRKEIFNTIFSSFILNENKSLILNGVRIPRMEFPPFIQGILKAFNISLKTPYYLVLNNYVYFSQSAESLSAVYSTFSNGTNISFSENWKAVSKNNEPASISLFYDLERSRPFFVNSNSGISNILELYSIGRTNIGINNSCINFTLNAVSRRKSGLRNVPGFPVELNGNHDSKILTCNVKNPSTIFWLENKQTLKAMNIKKTLTYTYELPASSVIRQTSNGEKEMVMALTKNSQLFLFNEKLEVEKGYPVFIPDDFIDTPYLSFEESFVPAESGKFYKIKNRKISVMDFGLESFDNSKLVANYNGTLGTIYERGFLGKIFVLKNGECINKDNPIMLDKIGFEGPAITADNKYVGFVSQSGNVYIWNITDNDTAEEYFEIQLDGIFNINLASSKENFFALSTTGEIFKINLPEKSVTSVQIDYVTAKEGRISVQTVKGENYLTVGIDGNLIYCFNEDLELVSGFPIAGNGIPAFADVNGDNSPDCFALTVDNKLNAWNLR